MPARTGFTNYAYAQTDRSNATGLELGMRIALWFQGMHRTPSPEEIQGAWGVSRATSYRWRQHWLAATGQHSDTTTSPAATGTTATPRTPQ